jgi:predicted lipoprotein with Yx(FWY)xxD motif
MSPRPGAYEGVTSSRMGRTTRRSSTSDLRSSEERSGGVATTVAAGGATVAVHLSKLGKILVDDSGRTLYLFEKDKLGTSACSGACATSWPPYTISGTPKAGSGAAAAELVTTNRADGATQVVCHGHPAVPLRR